MPASPASLSTDQIPRLLLSLRDVAQSLSVSERTSWQLVKSGQLTCVRIGRSVRVPLDDLRAYVDRKQQAAAKEAKT